MGVGQFAVQLIGEPAQPPRRFVVDRLVGDPARDKVLDAILDQLRGLMPDLPKSKGDAAPAGGCELNPPRCLFLFPIRSRLAILRFSAVTLPRYHPARQNGASCAACVRLRPRACGLRVEHGTSGCLVSR